MFPIVNNSIVQLFLLHFRLPPSPLGTVPFIHCYQALIDHLWALYPIASYSGSQWAGKWLCACT